MPEFLQLTPPQVALKRLLEHLPVAGVRCEWVGTVSGLGRITATDVVAHEMLPAFSRSTMDGYAVRAADTLGASESLPAYLKLVGEVPMGMQSTFELLPGQAALIHTGGMLPKGCDGVVMIEVTQVTLPDEVEILRAVAAGENILKAGEDVSVGQVVIPSGRRLRPAEIGGLLALGFQRVEVAALPRVGILSSGDEVLPPDQVPQPGQIRDINSYTLTALVNQAGGQAILYGIVPDQRAALDAKLREALAECDLVLITAGSSASTRDLTAEVIAEMGAPGVLVHGVNVRPGKPTILAVCNGKPVIGLPGNPVSALVIARLFVVPVIERLTGQQPEIKPFIQARLRVNLPSQAGREDWHPVKLIEGAQGLEAAPIFYKSNLIFSLVQADGLAFISADANGAAAGELVRVLLLQ